MKNPTRRPDILLKELENESLLYNESHKEIHVLNPTARQIWELCDGEHTLDDIEQSIRSHFAVPPDRNLREDILQTLKVFNSKGLLLAK